MHAPHTRRALVAGALGFAALGSLGTLALTNALGSSHPVVNFAPAAATANRHPARCRNNHLDAATRAKVREAAEKAVPGATFRGARHDRTNPDGYVALMRKADGTRVLVHEDANFNVTKVDDPAPPRRGRA